MTRTFKRALKYLFENEGGYSNVKEDHGGRTRFGITEAAAKQYCFDVSSLTRAQAEIVYEREYWRYDWIVSPDLAIKVFDFAVNAGNVQANKILQRACNATGLRTFLEEDGIIGPKTRYIVNLLDWEMLLKQFARLQGEFYKSLIAKDPTQKVFARGWASRAARVPEEEGVNA